MNSCFRKVYEFSYFTPTAFMSRFILAGGVDWIRLAQDRDRWRAVVSAVMNLRVLASLS
jgi:hypothetical protein